MKRCLHCGRPIEHRQAKAKYCTGTCRQEHNNAKHKAERHAARKIKLAGARQ